MDTAESSAIDGWDSRGHDENLGDDGMINWSVPQVDVTNVGADKRSWTTGVTSHDAVWSRTVNVCSTDPHGWSAQAWRSGAAKSWYSSSAYWTDNWYNQGNNFGKTADDTSSQVSHVPVPDDESVTAAREALDDSKRLATLNEEIPDAALYCTAIRLFAARGDSGEALNLLDEMKDVFGLEADAESYVALLEACEGKHPLERAWCLLDDMRRQSVDPFDARWKGSRRLEVHTVDGLLRHAQAWLTGSLPREAAAVALSVATTLSEQGRLDSKVQSNLNRRIVRPVVEALQREAAPGCRGILSVPSLGVFTDEALRDLAVSVLPARMKQMAQEELRRHGMLRRWAAWSEAPTAGLLTWISYDLSGSTWDMRSDGKVFGSSPALSSDNVLLGSVPENGEAEHAERRALVFLTGQLLTAFQDQGQESGRVDGVVMLYSQQPPKVASIQAMRQFLNFFPWVRLYVGHSQPEKALSHQKIGECGDARASLGKDGKGGRGKGKHKDGMPLAHKLP